MFLVTFVLEIVWYVFFVSCKWVINTVVAVPVCGYISPRKANFDTRVLTGHTVYLFVGIVWICMVETWVKCVTS